MALMSKERTEVMPFSMRQIRKTRLLQRIRDMRELADSVNGELHVAIAQTADLGVPHDHLAERAYLGTADITAILAEFTAEDLAELDESETTWVPYHNGAVFI